MFLNVFLKWRSRNIILNLVIAACFMFLISFLTLISQTARAQNWTALPPYNTLWPLWSSVLSPVNLKTGLPTPLVTNLAPSTILPVQPCLTWDINLGYPWLLYNTPLGMAYYDPYKGVKLWPDSILLNVFTGLANPVTLPANYQYLTGPPFLGSWLLSNVAVANSAYQTAYIAFYNAALPLSKTLAAIFTSTPPPVLPVISLLPNTAVIP